MFPGRCASAMFDPVLQIGQAVNRPTATLHERGPGCPLHVISANCTARMASGRRAAEPDTVPIMRLAIMPMQGMTRCVQVLTQRPMTGNGDTLLET